MKRLASRSTTVNVDSSLSTKNSRLPREHDRPDVMSTHLSGQLGELNSQLNNPDTNDQIIAFSPGQELDDRLSLRALAAGLVIGILVCICNIYFALQTGWGSGMTLPSALIGFTIFKLFSSLLKKPFTIAENVLISTVAAAAGTVCLGSGFTGVIPAMEFLLKSEEGAPLDLNLGRLTVWSLGTCTVGAMFAPVLWDRMILKEKLPFPTGTATAALISTLHEEQAVSQKRLATTHVALEDTETQGLLDNENEEDLNNESFIDGDNQGTAHGLGNNLFAGTQRRRSLSLVLPVLVSATFILVSYFIPQLRSIPIFGNNLASQWLWTFDPSPAYVGQGVLMGTVTSLHLVVGMVVGWAVLSPLAVYKGWVTGRVDDYEQGVKGWLTWIALSILLADSALQLGWMIFRICARSSSSVLESSQDRRSASTPSNTITGTIRRVFDSAIPTEPGSPRHSSHSEAPFTRAEPPSPPLQSRLVIHATLGLVIVVSVSLIYASFRDYLQFLAAILAICFGLLAALIGTRTLGETDTLPNSAIAKLSQLLFSFVVPASSHGAVVVNLVAGSISESTSERAGQMMQDFKTAQLSSISAKVQLQGGIIGGLFGAIISPALYRMYTSVYEPPSRLFQMPHAYLYIFTARLLMGQGLPKMIPQVGIAFGLMFLALTAIRIVLACHPTSKYHKWYSFIPNGVAVAIGMYTTPSFTLARAVGGLVNWWYLRRYPNDGTNATLLASGLVIGEGLASIINLVLTSLHVPHL